MRLCSFAAAALLLSASLAAHADDIFTLSDGTNLVTFELPSTPTPLPSTACPTDPSYFCVYNVPVTTNGVTMSSNFIAFFTSAEQGGLAIEEGAGFLLSQEGATLFTGSTSAPMFLPQVSDLTNVGPGMPSTLQLNFTVTIVPTPEPSSFALLGTGLLGAAGVLKRRFA